MHVGKQRPAILQHAVSSLPLHTIMNWLDGFICGLLQHHAAILSKPDCPQNVQSSRQQCSGSDLLVSVLTCFDTSLYQSSTLKLTQLYVHQGTVMTHVLLQANGAVCNFSVMRIYSHSETSSLTIDQRCFCGDCHCSGQLHSMVGNFC